MLINGMVGGYPVYYLHFGLICGGANFIVNWQNMKWNTCNQQDLSFNKNLFYKCITLGAYIVH